MTRTTRLVFLAALAAGPAPAADGVDFFEAKVRPVLADHCYSCHSAKAGKAKGGLTLDTPAGIRKGGDSGPLWEPAGDSLLLKALAHDPDGHQMPPKGKLPAALIADIRKWVMLGGPLPADAPTQAAATPATGKDHWAFKPLARHAAPAVADPGWVRGPIDPFIRKKLDENRMRPAPEADRRTLARRLFFDLTGLPPTFEAVEAFAADPAPDAYGKLVDRLLASPGFGEKWGRHWLDVARYAEDNSTGESTIQAPKAPHAYRDWVIRAVNADLPYDEFLRRQLAADRLGLPPAEYAALGFLALGPYYHKEPKLAKDVIAGVVADEWDERIDAITRGVLGLTVACARCHDHKFDPVTQQDYYALAGVMASTQPVETPLGPATPAEAEALSAVRAEAFKARMYLQAAQADRNAAKREKNPDLPALEQKVAEWQKRADDLKAREKALYAGPVANAVRDASLWLDASDPAWTWVEYRPGEAQDLPVYVRGNPARPGAVAPRRFLAVLSAGDPTPFRDGSGRRELADCLVRDAGPLTARVFVNRVWGWLFGTGLVATPSNFGKLGDPPSHPELLDDLAARFVEEGWSLKKLVRELVLSATYRQSARPDADFQQRDPEDRLLWRAPRKRLTLEQWRDAALSSAGLLKADAGGPSEPLDAPDSLRRTVYGKVSRSRPSDLHRLFDLPDPVAHGEKRTLTTTPLQQLYLMNGPLARRAADALAASAGGEPGCADDEAARELFRRVLLREPGADELAAAVELARGGGGPPAWGRVAQALLVCNEFMFLD